jgi:hypothetical protein
MEIFPEPANEHLHFINLTLSPSVVMGGDIRQAYYY